MRLLYMDVDRYGTNDRCRLGPLANGLNAICGPKGSGKTTLLNWLRMVAQERFGAVYAQPDPVWNQSQPPISGTIDIENRGLTMRFASDRNGRIKSDLHGRSLEPSLPYRGTGGDSASAYREVTGIEAAALTQAQRDAFVGLAAASGATDTELALDNLASQLGVSRQAVRNDNREQLLVRERGLREQLDRLPRPTSGRETLESRHRQLESELAALQERHSAHGLVPSPVDQRRLDERLSAAETDLRNALHQIQDLDRSIAEKSAELKLLEGPSAVPEISESYRRQLQQLDDRLDRWRQTLRDLKTHRESIESNATDARLDRQVGDQLSATKDSDPRSAMRSLEAQIVNTRQQLDALVDHYKTIPGYDYPVGESLRATDRAEQDVYRDASGRTYIGYSRAQSLGNPAPGNLPETLLGMQRDLREVCQQLARHESKSAAETLHQQSLQLKRCEDELLQSVEKLIDERAGLLRRIADEHHLSVEQLTLAFGQWCQCHDHPHLHEWLLNEENRLENAGQVPGNGAEAVGRIGLIEEIGALRQTRKQQTLRADDCRRQINEANLHRRELLPRPAGAVFDRDYDASRSKLQGEMDQIANDLNLLNELDRRSAELRDVQRELQDLPSTNGAACLFREQANQHIARLMPERSFHAGRERHSFRYDLVDGIVPDTVRYEESREVPSAIVRMAMRLTIAQAMVQRGEPISLILDETLDEVEPVIQRSAVSHLAQVAQSGQQIVVLTGDERVVDLIRAHQGWVGYMHASAPAVDLDVNRHLSAVANDHEADKWYRPVSAESSVASDYYLSERGLIEDLPSIDPTEAARCRAIGIDRIGDLLDVDPHWLAENLRLEGVRQSTVVRWQAEARLLCSVRGLRPFDARVLVGAGIRTPGQLAEMHPSQLLNRVEQFLATDRGRRILRSGNSYELSRITSWIASAKGGGRRFDRTSIDDGDVRARDSYDRDAAGNGYDRHGRRTRSNHGSTSRSSLRRSRSGTDDRRSRAYPVVSRAGRDERYSETESRQERSSRNGKVSRGERKAVRIADTGSGESSGHRKFYLELSSPVVDAPSIGPRMATRLEDQGVYTVDQLLVADAESLADKMNHRRVDAETILAWQEQARLVCRIPNLRGHDAQLLVACELTSPEELANADADNVLTQVLEIAKSKEGQRILRGSKDPDLDEVNDWIHWAANSRKLNAA